MAASAGLPTQRLELRARAPDEALMLALRAALSDDGGWQLAAIQEALNRDEIDEDDEDEDEDAEVAVALAVALNLAPSLTLALTLTLTLAPTLTLTLDPTPTLTLTLTLTRWPSALPLSPWRVRPWSGAPSGRASSRTSSF